jgi:hypothetical protein
MTSRKVHIFDKKNVVILEELKTDSFEEKLYTNRNNWLQHFHRMEENRLPKRVLNYHQTKSQIGALSEDWAS